MLNNSQADTDCCSLPLQIPVLRVYCILPLIPELLYSGEGQGYIFTEGEENVKRCFANTQFGLNIGMGLMAGKKAQLFVRYCFGFNDLTRFDDNADYSRVLQAGFLFRLK